ncbi:hypothetical protein [Actinosynnema sp. NPDC020468]|uniref:hypothetical protein n=1 Tax=Actinosynnema sp. NPDC020468 TaxID=3154488 RepID=UPI0033D899FD
MPGHPHRTRWPSACLLILGLTFAAIAMHHLPAPAPTPHPGITRTSGHAAASSAALGEEHGGGDHGARDQDSGEHRTGSQGSGDHDSRDQGSRDQGSGIHSGGNQGGGEHGGDQDSGVHSGGTQDGGSQGGGEHGPGGLHLCVAVVGVLPGSTLVHLTKSLLASPSAPIVELLAGRIVERFYLSHVRPSPHRVLDLVGVLRL